MRSDLRLLRISGRLQQVFSRSVICPQILLPTKVYCADKAYLESSKIYPQGSDCSLRVCDDEPARRGSPRSHRQINACNTRGFWVGPCKNEQGNPATVSFSHYLPESTVLTLSLSIESIELNHYARMNGEYPTYEAEVALANSAYRMQTYYEYIQMKQVRKETGSGGGNWNQVSIGKLVTGRS